MPIRADRESHRQKPTVTDIVADQKAALALLIVVLARPPSVKTNKMSSAASLPPRRWTAFSSCMSANVAVGLSNMPSKRSIQLCFSMIVVSDVIIPSSRAVLCCRPGREPLALRF